MACGSSRATDWTCTMTTLDPYLLSHRRTPVYESLLYWSSQISLKNLCDCTSVRIHKRNIYYNALEIILQESFYILKWEYKQKFRWCECAWGFHYKISLQWEAISMKQIFKHVTRLCVCMCLLIYLSVYLSRENVSDVGNLTDCLCENFRAKWGFKWGLLVCSFFIMTIWCGCYHLKKKFYQKCFIGNVWIIKTKLSSDHEKTKNSPINPHNLLL